MKKLLIIDSHSLIHRAYHALPPLTAPSGEPTGAVYGFTSMVLKSIKDLQPDFAVAAFDLPGPTFRHIEFQAYKATRPPAHQDLISQIEKSKKILDALGMAFVASPGFEADDIIGTLATNAKNDPELEVLILSGDLDILQLASEQVRVLMPKRSISDITNYDDRAVKERYGFGPEFIVDYKALRGDPSDNIPGVRGIGEKTASALIINFGGIENLYRELESLTENKPPLTPAVRKKLIEGKNDAFLSKKIATISINAPINKDLLAYIFKSEKKPEAEKLFSELGFKTLLARIKEV